MMLGTEIRASNILGNHPRSELQMLAVFYIVNDIDSQGVTLAPALY